MLIVIMAENDLVIEYDDTVLPPLSITDRYSHDMSILYMFKELGLSDAKHTRLINDGISSIEALVGQ